MDCNEGNVAQTLGNYDFKNKFGLRINEMLHYPSRSAFHIILYLISNT